MTLKLSQTDISTILLFRLGGSVFGQQIFYAVYAHS